MIIKIIKKAEYKTPPFYNIPINYFLKFAASSDPSVAVPLV